MGSLFLGVPGGIELLILLFIALVVFGLPIVLLGGGLYLYRRTQSDESASDELEALRTEVEQLREEIQRMERDQSTEDRSENERREANDQSENDQSENET
jgi:sec-independent protein translocase protein TatA